MALSWGKPRLFAKKLGDVTAKWFEIPTPVENSTVLTPTKGDKKEAKLEGGENEDVKYAKNTYLAEYKIRHAIGKKMPYNDEDGIIAGNYALACQPEDPLAPGFLIDKSVVSAQHEFGTEEGGVATYTHDVLKPESGKQVKFGVITVTEADGVISDITVTESEAA